MARRRRATTYRGSPRTEVRPADPEQRRDDRRQRDRPPNLVWTSESEQKQGRRKEQQ